MPGTAAGDVVSLNFDITTAGGNTFGAGFYTVTGYVAFGATGGGGNLIYLERIQPTFPQGATISTEKARTAALFQKPTKILEDAIVGGRTPLLNAWSAPLNGGEPILVDGQVVGAIGVSGASSAARDAVIATAGAAALRGQTSATR